jgi:pimeloyl-ACP methyl ester carboxylesterase
MVMRGKRPKDREPNEEEQAALKAAAHYAEWDSGYSTQQGTRPQTVGYGLTDSPAGQLAWILEKFWAWTDNEGHPEDALTRDEMLDNVMLYWVTNSATSSARLYWESFRSSRPAPVTVPTGVACFPYEIIPPVRAWSEGIYSDIRRWTKMPKGGHFAAFEQPELFIEDVRSFFAEIR